MYRKREKKVLLSIPVDYDSFNLRYREGRHLK
jgi:hypothetical protein